MFEIDNVTSAELTDNVQIDIRYSSWSLPKVNSTFIYCLIFSFDIVQNQSEIFMMFNNYYVEAI